MKKTKVMWILLAVLSLMGKGLMSYAQLDIPKENIPASTPANVRGQIERLPRKNCMLPVCFREPLGTLYDRHVKRKTVERSAGKR